MHHLAAFSGLILALAPAAYAQDLPAPEGPVPGEVLWNAEASVSLAGAYDLTRPRSPEGPLARSGAVRPAAEGRYYLRPLQDAPDVPLALLSFYRHPGYLGLGLTQQTELNRVATRWRTSRRGLGVSASGSAYPWEDTGVTADVGADYSGISGTTHDALALHYQAGLVHYFRANLRGEVRYLGSVSQSSRLSQSSAAGALQDDEEADNAGQLAAEVLLLQDRLGVRAQVEVGQLTQDRTVTGLGGNALPGEVTDGLTFAALATATGYFGRQFSAALAGGLSGRSEKVHPDPGGGAASSTTTLSPVVAPSATFFFQDNLFATARYAIAFPQVDGNGAPSSSGVDQTLTGSLAIRL